VLNSHLFEEEEPSSCVNNSLQIQIEHVHVHVFEWLFTSSGTSVSKSINLYQLAGKSEGDEETRFSSSRDMLDRHAPNSSCIPPLKECIEGD
jgi:hypothetical protein